MKKIMILLILMSLLLSLNVSVGWFDEVKEYFAKKGNTIPEYQCNIHFKNFDTFNYIQSSEECIPFFIKCQKSVTTTSEYTGGMLAFSSGHYLSNTPKVYALV